MAEFISASNDFDMADMNSFTTGGCCSDEEDTQGGINGLDLI